MGEQPTSFDWRNLDAFHGVAFIDGAVQRAEDTALEAHRIAHASDDGFGRWADTFGVPVLQQPHRKVRSKSRVMFRGRHRWWADDNFPKDRERTMRKGALATGDSPGVSLLHHLFVTVGATQAVAIGHQFTADERALLDRLGIEAQEW